MANWEKIYNRINWKNEDVSKNTPVSAGNLNLMDSAIDMLDSRIIQLKNSGSGGGGGGASSWDDLEDKPFEELGDDFSVNDDDELELSSSIKTKINKTDNLATVATSGSYNDLSDKPIITIPEVYNGKLTFLYNGEKIFEFSANESGDKLADLPLPTWGMIGDRPFVSFGDDFNVNVQGVVKLANAIPTKTSQLTNDSGFLTEHQDISNKADKATSLEGYGITDAYTKNEIDSQIGDVESLLAAL